MHDIAKPKFGQNDEVRGTLKDSLMYSIQEKVKSPKYTGDFLIDLNGINFSFKRFQDVGMFEPIRIKQKTDTGKILNNI